MSNSTQFKNSTIGVGDKVKVVQRILESGKERRQIFIGTIIKIGGDKDNKSMTVRKIGVNQIGIEKIYLLNKPVNEVQKEDCIFSDSAVATVYSGQTLCVNTMEGNVAAIGGTWQEMPTELEWKMFG